MSRKSPPLCPTRALAILSLAAGLSSTHAYAHARLVGAQPAPNATVAAPKVIRLEFSEEVAPSFSSFTLSDAQGRDVASGRASSEDSKALTAALGQRLDPGVYSVSWTAVATDDGHRTSGLYHFTVK